MTICPDWNRYWVKMGFNQRKPMSLTDYVAEVEKNLGDPVDERWWVEEYFPAWEDHHYGYTNPERIHQKSHYFDSEEAAQKFIESSRTTFPDTELRIRHQRCYERTERYWI